MRLKEILMNNVFKGKLEDIDLYDKMIISTINPHSYCVAKNDRMFQEALLTSDYLLPDGEGICLASKVLLDSKIKKIAGFDIHRYLLKMASIMGQRVFYLGSNQNTLEGIMRKVKLQYPNITVQSLSPKYTEVFSEEDCYEMIESVNNFRADILFVGMTAPKQEKWVYQNKDRINANTIVSIGAVFDFYAETKSRPNQIWIDLRMEWLIRLVSEPKRLWKRNFVSTPIFLYDLIKEKIRITLD